MPSSISTRQEFLQILQENPGIIFIKFTAAWCVPCKKIYDIVHTTFLNTPANVLFYEIDIDHHSDVFAFLKHKKMVKSIPSILMWKKDNDSYVPSDSITSSDPKEIRLFFTNTL